MNTPLLTSGELARLDKLNQLSNDADFSWAKARMRSLNSELRKLQTELNSLKDVQDLNSIKQNKEEENK